MKIGNQNLAFESVANSANDSIESLETHYFDYQSIQNDAKFNLPFRSTGSKQVKMVPIGKTTDAKMTSNWNYLILMETSHLFQEKLPITDLKHIGKYCILTDHLLKTTLKYYHN